MKYLFICLAVTIVIGGGLFVFVQQTTTQTSIEQNTSDDSNHTESNAHENDIIISDSDESKNEVKTSQASVTLDPNAKVFAIKGVNYGFDVQEIKVKKGDTVTINFESTDGFHDWVIDTFKAYTNKVQPGVPTSVTFIATEAGTFEYYSSVGNQRDLGMVGTFIVEDSE